MDEETFALLPFVRYFPVDVKRVGMMKLFPIGIILSFGLWIHLLANTPDAPVNWLKAFFQSRHHASIPEVEDGYGVVFRDLNDDQWADVYLVRFRNLNRLFVNPGNPRLFMDATISSGLGGDLLPGKLTHLELAGTAADFNRDGRLDMFIAGWGGVSTLMVQKNNFRFQNWTWHAGIDPQIDANIGVWGDVNNDGALDLFITTEQGENKLYINDGFGRFQNRAIEWGVASTAASQSAALVDVNRDGLPDLYVCNWFAPDEFYRNVDGKRFQRVRLFLPHLLEDHQSNGVTFGDVNNDQRLDLLVTDREGHTRLYLNQTLPGDTSWQFLPASGEWNIQVNEPAYGGVIADFDNDGWQDIFLTTIGSNYFFWNRRGKGWVSRKVDTTVKAYSTGCAVADADHDGDLDLFVANKDTSAFLYLNPLTATRFLRVRLHGVTSNREAIGTQVWLLLEAGDSLKTIAYRVLQSVEGYLSQSEPVVHFGIPEGEKFSLRVLFPSGRDIWISHVLPNQIVDVWEHQGIARWLLLARQHVNLLLHKPAFTRDALVLLGILLTIAAFLFLASRRYQLSAVQSNSVVFVVIALLYAIFLWRGQELTTQVLLLQWGAVTAVLGIAVAYLEKVRYMEMARYKQRQLLRNFAQELILIKQLPDLYGRITTTIYQALQPDYVVLYEVADQQITLRTQAGNSTGVPSTLPRPKSVELKGVWESDVVQQLFPQFPYQTLQVALPVFRGSQWLALLMIGQRKVKPSPTTADREILQILTSQAAIAIENIHYIEETRALTQQLTEARVREQYVQELEEKNRSLEQLNAQLKETQMQLVHSEKMASLGQLVAGIAHELNNPISFVYSNMTVLRDYMNTLEQLRQQLQHNPAVTLTENDRQKVLEILADMHQLVSESLDGSQRVKEVVQNLRNFSRLDQAAWKTVDIHTGLEATLRLLAHEIRGRITVLREYGTLPPVLCQPGALNQVFMNILVNAIQAIPEKGKIIIRTRQENQQVVIEIEDTGRGIPPEILSRIFDPFFTTKPVGEGTGLGLSISYRIIQDHGGRIDVWSEVGKGTRFTIVLPIHGKRVTQTGDENHGHQKN